MRFSDYDRSLHEFTMRPGHGIALLGKPPAAVGLLTGIAQLLPEPTASRVAAESDA
jgi:hypothetical protein